MALRNKQPVLSLLALTALLLAQPAVFAGGHGAGGGHSAGSASTGGSTGGSATSQGSNTSFSGSSSFGSGNGAQGGGGKFASGQQFNSTPPAVTPRQIPSGAGYLYGWGTGYGRRGYVGGGGNNNTDNTDYQYTPSGQTAAGGDVDPSLQRSDFVKNYSWPKK